MIILRFILRYFIIAIVIGTITGTVVYRYRRAKDKIEDDGVIGLIIDVISRFCNLGLIILIIRFSIKAITE